MQAYTQRPDVIQYDAVAYINSMTDRFALAIKVHTCVTAALYSHTCDDDVYEQKDSHSPVSI